MAAAASSFFVDALESGVLQSEQMYVFEHLRGVNVTFSISDRTCRTFLPSFCLVFSKEYLLYPFFFLRKGQPQLTHPSSAMVVVWSVKLFKIVYFQKILHSNILIV